MKTLRALIMMGAAINVAPALAHPHVFGTAQVEVVISPSKEMTAFRHKWVFDEEYSRMAVESLGGGSAAALTREKLQPLADVNVEELKKLDYFTFAKRGKDKIELADARGQYLEYKDKILSLIFEIPLAKPVSLRGKAKFVFSIYDPTYFVDLALDETLPVSLSGSTRGCRTDIEGPEPPKETTLSQAADLTADGTPNLGSLYAKKVTVRCED
jgi:ABC-type uncharacterized transport system substrate-binding protein